MKALISRTILSNIGKKIDRKIIVIESDDWGANRMPSKMAFENLLRQGIAVDKCPYNSFDGFETFEDIEALMHFCTKYKDRNGNPLKITANFIMANPNFEKIRDSGFEKYYYRDLKTSYQYYQGNDKTFKSIQAAIAENIIVPQLHGREHLQVHHWLSALKSGDSETLWAFNNDVWGHPSSFEKKYGINFSSAFHLTSKMELQFAKESVLDASKLFQTHFGFMSQTFIAPRYILPCELEGSLYEAGIRTLQGLHFQLNYSMVAKNNKLIKTFNWMGKNNDFGLNYLIRNVFFEPTQKPNHCWEADAMNRITTAFYWRKPAIISMHRLNLMGGLSSENRKFTLERLGNLISNVQRKFPDVEFLSSNELSAVLYEK